MHTRLLFAHGQDAAVGGDVRGLEGGEEGEEAIAEGGGEPALGFQLGFVYVSVYIIYVSCQTYTYIHIYVNQQGQQYNTSSTPTSSRSALAPPETMPITHTHTHIRICIHIHTYTHTYIYIHIYTPTNLPPPAVPWPPRWPARACGGRAPGGGGRRAGCDRKEQIGEGEMGDQVSIRCGGKYGKNYVIGSCLIYHICVHSPYDTTYIHDD